MAKDSTIITRYELIEVLVSATAQQGQLQLPSNVSTLQNNPERKIYIKDVEIFPDYAQASSIKNTGVIGLPVAEVAKISLSIYYDDAVFIRYIPAAKLIYTQPPAGIVCPFQQERVAFDNLYPVNIDQCFLNFNQAPAGMPYVVPIGITYMAVPVLTKQ